MSTKSIKSILIREQKRYSLFDLIKIFDLSEQEIKILLKKLKLYNIVKTVKNSIRQKQSFELLDDEIENVEVLIDNNEYLYVFTYVGVVIVSGLVIKCYPKYIFNNDNPIKELKLVLKVIEKFNKNEQIIKFQDNLLDGTASNKIAAMLYFLNDYYDNGIYTNISNTIEVNGNGEINWDKTINETYALINQNRPYYTDLFTKKKINNEYDYFKRLHETILTICSKYLEACGLLELFDLLAVNLSDEGLDDFGEAEYILGQIQKEISSQFNTRKQLLLKSFYSFVANGGGKFNRSDFSLYGTSSFHVIWEKVCAIVIDNHLETNLDELPLLYGLSDDYIDYSKTSLINLIERPKWAVRNTGKPHESEKTFTPDLINLNVNSNGELQFLIFDAKYYNLCLNEKTLSGQPGVESISKQYLYQLAYKDFLEKQNISIVKNCFLFPTETDQFMNIGEVYLEMLDNLGLEKIQLIMLPSHVVYKCFLSNKRLDLSKLEI